MEKVNVAYNLKLAESSLDLSTDAINIANQKEYIKKQEKFKQTVMGAYDICSKKLYKATDPTLEDYFRRKWKISRAQVYRFLDAAAVLKQLEDFKYQPSHERLCRTLKQHAKIPEHMRLLWSKVLESAGDRLTSINSALVANVWNDMLKKGVISMKEVEKAAASKKKRRGSGNRKQSSNKSQKISKVEKHKIDTLKDSNNNSGSNSNKNNNNNNLKNYTTNKIKNSSSFIEDYNHSSSPSMTLNKLNLLKQASSSTNSNNNTNTFIITPSVTQQAISSLSNISIPQNNLHTTTQQNSIITSPSNISSHTIPPLTPPSQSPLIQQQINPSNSLTAQNSISSQNTVASQTNPSSNNPSPNPTITSPYVVQPASYTSIGQSSIQMFPTYTTNPSLNNTPSKSTTQSQQIKNISMTIPSPPVYNDNFNVTSQSNTITVIAATQLPTQAAPTQILNSPNIISTQVQQVQIQVQAPVQAPVQTPVQNQIIINSQTNTSPTMMNNSNYQPPISVNSNTQPAQNQSPNNQSVTQIINSGNPYQTPSTQQLIEPSSISIPVQNRQYSPIVLQTPQQSPSMLNSNSSNSSQTQNIMNQSQNSSWVTYSTQGQIQQQPTPPQTHNNEIQIQNSQSQFKSVVNLFNNPLTSKYNNSTYYSDQNNSSQDQAVSNTYQVYSISQQTQNQNQPQTQTQTQTQSQLQAQSQSQQSQSQSQTQLQSTQHQQGQQIIYTSTNVQGSNVINQNQNQNQQPSPQSQQIIYTTTTNNSQDSSNRPSIFNQNQNPIQQPSQQTNIIYTTSTNVHGGSTFINQNQNQSINPTQTQTQTQNQTHNQNQNQNPQQTNTIFGVNPAAQNQQPSYIYSNNVQAIGVNFQNNTINSSQNQNNSYMVTSSQKVTLINGNQQSQLIPSQNQSQATQPTNLINSQWNNKSNFQTSLNNNPNSNPQNYYTTSSSYISVNNITNPQIKEERTNLNYILNK
ncbi:hypothetical protein BCR32DRAFT_272567 [Anaeromyces robustus]|uniref:Uncharacterized protein n=1 Tax=Anaeromyces robustus TaxID=1754192 RepID=A0A1Y1W336_9FUNG|nr:hypothetical protein BCR32DRAFT_272567 [Anaeromyces robustus]|eukprot:ORX67696.1 hypothetical protein BCR32DRAFT_272567 [Anaeromyces robustus]